MKVLLIAAVLIPGIGFAMAQDGTPGNKSEAASPAPPAQQSAPPDKVAPGNSNSSYAARPDDTAEAKTLALKMDSAEDKKLPPTSGTIGQDTTSPRS